MGYLHNTIWEKLWPLIIRAIPIGCFFLFCIKGKLQADLSADNLDRIVVRICLVVVFSLFIAYRLPSSIVQGRSGLFRQLSVVILFLGILYFPLVSQFSFISTSVKSVKHEITRNYESRSDKLFALLRAFPSTYEKYMDKHFTFSKMFVHLDALVKVYVLGVSPNNNVAVGKNGFYFEGWGARKVEKGIVENFDNIADYMGQIPFSKDELRQWKRTLEERKYWLREKGSEYVFVLAPTKALVYPEYLPTSLQKAVNSGGTTRYEQLTEYLKRHADIHFIDLLPPLLEAKKKRDYPLLFYKTDFHWNFYGAFIAYQAIIDSLKKFYPEYDLKRPLFSEFELDVDEHWAHHRFMNMIGLPASMHKNEHYITMVPKQGGRWDSGGDIPVEGIHDVYPPERKITAEDGTSIDIRLLLNPKASIPSILLLGDSFFEKCVYFFSGDARRVLNFRTIVNFPDTIFDYEKPDIVIQEILNMFILRKPPENPPGFKLSYLKGVFGDNAQHVLIKGDENSFRLEGNRATVTFPESLATAPKEMVRIMKISGYGVKKGKIEILPVVAGQSLKPEYRMVTEGFNQWYIEFPENTSVGGVDFSTEHGDISDLYVPQKYEVRYK